MNARATSHTHPCSINVRASESWTHINDCKLPMLLGMLPLRRLLLRTKDLPNHPQGSSEADCSQWYFEAEFRHLHLLRTVGSSMPRVMSGCCRPQRCDADLGRWCKSETQARALPLRRRSLRAPTHCPPQARPVGRAYVSATTDPMLDGMLPFKALFSKHRYLLHREHTPAAAGNRNLITTTALVRAQCYTLAGAGKGASVL